MRIRTLGIWRLTISMHLRRNRHYNTYAVRWFDLRAVRFSIIVMVNRTQFSEWLQILWLPKAGRKLLKNLSLEGTGLYYYNIWLELYYIEFGLPIGCQLCTYCTYLCMYIDSSPANILVKGVTLVSVYKDKFILIASYFLWFLFSGKSSNSTRTRLELIFYGPETSGIIISIKKHSIVLYLYTIYIRNAQINISFIVCSQSLGIRLRFCI